MFPVVWLQNPMLIFQNCLLWLKTSFPDVSAPSAPKFSRLLLPVSFFQGDIDVSLRPQGDIDRWSVKRRGARYWLAFFFTPKKKTLYVRIYSERVRSRGAHHLKEKRPTRTELLTDSKNIDFPRSSEAPNAIDFQIGWPKSYWSIIQGIHSNHHAAVPPNVQINWVNWYSNSPRDNLVTNLRSEIMDSLILHTQNILIRQSQSKGNIWLPFF